MPDLVKDCDDRVQHCFSQMATPVKIITSCPNARMEETLESELTLNLCRGEQLFLSLSFNFGKVAFQHVIVISVHAEFDMPSERSEMECGGKLPAPQLFKLFVVRFQVTIYGG